jgi:hypothetical protein
VLLRKRILPPAAFGQRTSRQIACAVNLSSLSTATTVEHALHVRFNAQACTDISLAFKKRVALEPWLLGLA